MRANAALPSAPARDAIPAPRDGAIDGTVTLAATSPGCRVGSTRGVYARARARAGERGGIRHRFARIDRDTRRMPRHALLVPIAAALALAACGSDDAPVESERASTPVATA